MKGSPRHVWRAFLRIRFWLRLLRSRFTAGLILLATAFRLLTAVTGVPAFHFPLHSTHTAVSYEQEILNEWKGVRSSTYASERYIYSLWETDNKHARYFVARLFIHLAWYIHLFGYSLSESNQSSHLRELPDKWSWRVVVKFGFILLDLPIIMRTSVSLLL